MAYRVQSTVLNKCNEQLRKWNLDDTWPYSPPDCYLRSDVYGVGFSFPWLNLADAEILCDQIGKGGYLGKCLDSYARYDPAAMMRHDLDFKTLKNCVLKSYMYDGLASAASQFIHSAITRVSRFWSKS